MRRWLCSTRTVLGDHARLDSSLRERIGEMIAEVAGGDGEPAADGSRLVRLPGRVLGLDAAKTVRVRTGVASRREHRTVIPIEWEPEPGRLAFPSFEGAVELMPLDRGRCELTLVGSYTVPLGPVGAAVDAVALRAVAERTADELLGALAGALSAALRSPRAPAAPADVGPDAPLLVRDVMTVDPIVVIEDMPVRSAALLLFHLEVSGAPVVAVDGELLGVLSERDLLEKEALPLHGGGRAGAAAARRREALTVGEACTRPAVTTVPETPLREAARTMVERGISRLVVIDESRVAGILTRHDVLQALLRSDAELQAAAEEVLRRLSATTVRARVRWGVVEVEGRVQLRSEASTLLSQLRDIDGVVDVTGEVTWAEDDILPALIGHPYI